MESSGGLAQGSRYWNSYYSSSPKPLLPSQFAAFVAGELQRPSIVIDIGCGTGRDTFFFADHGHVAIGVDASEAAIEQCRSHAWQKQASCSFIASTIDSRGLLEEIEQKLQGVEMTRIIYSRFFLHAIDEQNEEHFLSLSERLVRGNGIIAVEFRTIRDRQLSKVTPEHYRRFINPLDFATRAQRHGFIINYFVEGFGFAKFRQDDAYVGRMLLSR